MIPVLFTLEDVVKASDEWGANCGPAALAAVLGLTLAEVRPHLGDFERKGYMNPTLMFQALRSTGARWQRLACPIEPQAAVLAADPPAYLPDHGLCRVQWEGPWTAPGVPMAARYRHTHWTGARHALGGVEIFDVNAMCVGGWIGFEEWRDQLVPWLLSECHPKAYGAWHLTHRLSVGLTQEAPGAGRAHAPRREGSTPSPATI